MKKNSGSVCYSTAVIRTCGFPDFLPVPMAIEGSVVCFSW